MKAANFPSPPPRSTRRNRIRTQTLLRKLSVTGPPTIARRIILDYIPTLTEKVFDNHVRAMETSKAALDAAGRAAESSKDFAALMAWLRTIGADADALDLMENALRDRLNHLAVDRVERITCRPNDL